MTKPKQEKLPGLETSDQHSDASEYGLLVGHETTVGAWKTTEELQRQYVALTDNIIQEVLNNRADSATSEECVVFLDKSARPVSWLMKELWPILAQQADGSIPEKPEIKFVNIDRNQWTGQIDPNGNGHTDVTRLDKSIFRSLRGAFLKDHGTAISGDSGEVNLGEDIDEAPTVFDGKSILLVDEVQSTGRTLDYSKKFFGRAFPEAEVRGTHWMSDKVSFQGGVGNADIPVWYDSKSSYGRGIGERDIAKSMQSKSRAQRIGAWFLSTPLEAPDPKSKQLRQEMKTLAADVKEGRVFIRPSLDSPDFEERALRLNGLSDIKDYTDIVQELYS